MLTYRSYMEIISNMGGPDKHLNTVIIVQENRKY
jgi:hypothetical protein